MWRFADAAWLYVVKDDERAGRALAALLVADLDEVVREVGSRVLVESRSTTSARPAARPTSVDADGNAISFIEVGEAG